MSIVEENEWNDAVARGGEVEDGDEWRTTEGWELKPPWVET